MVSINHPGELYSASMTSRAFRAIMPSTNERPRAVRDQWSRHIRHLEGTWITAKSASISMDSPRGARVRTPPHSSGARNGHGESGDRGHRQLPTLPTGYAEPRTESRPGSTTAALARADERQRLARDLHDGVQSELVALMLRLKLAEEDRTTPTALAGTFVALEDHAAAALASLREIAHGIYPLPLVKLGLAEALRARAARTPIKVSIQAQRLAAPTKPRPPFTCAAPKRSRTSLNTQAPPRKSSLACTTTTRCSPCESKMTVGGLTRHTLPTARG